MAGTLGIKGGLNQLVTSKDVPITHERHFMSDLSCTDPHNKNPTAMSGLSIMGANKCLNSWFKLPFLVFRELVDQTRESISQRNPQVQLTHTLSGVNFPCQLYGTG